MVRIILGGILAFWGGAATIYGLTLPIADGVYGLSQLAACVATGCMCLVGLALVASGAGWYRPLGRNREREPEREFDRERDRRGNGYRQENGIAPRTVAAVAGCILLFIGLVVGAVFVAKNRNRPAQAGLVPAPRPNAAPAQPARPVLKPGLSQTAPTGGSFARNDYRESRDDHALLIGFEVGRGKVFNTDVISYLRPIWLTADGEQFGTAYGRTDGPIVTVKARDGYAVGGIVTAGGGALEGFVLTFMRRGEKSLIADDAYTSDWYGEPTRKPPAERMRAGDGPFVVGLLGKRFDDRGGKNFDDGGAIATIGFVLLAKE